MTEINPNLKGKYTIVGLQAGVTKVALANLGEVDFAKISLLQADTLHALGCKYLKKVEPQPKAKASTKKAAAADG